ncbi:hypothetical protein EVAR_85093_1 [Eumeta japonica]|uniref:Uncharacterized protein n=1 Tax=Eumeta variegata TaxID=151549 RepID=A0A4C1XQP9_EUMVA|nr:hypothetical protein EVAR_85093_1 [Eumeta japonica]
MGLQPFTLSSSSSSLIRETVNHRPYPRGDDVQVTRHDSLSTNMVREVEAGRHARLEARPSRSPIQYERG